MKIVGAIARYLLGFAFLVFGLNSFLQFIPPGPPQPGNAGIFLKVLMDTHFFYGVGAVMGVAGILLLFNRFVGLGLTLLGPILFNILLFHLTMAPSTIGAGVVATLLWAMVAWQHSEAFAPLFKAKLPA